MDRVSSTIERLGGDPTAFVQLWSSTPQSLPYATLLDARRSDVRCFNSIIGVYEWQGRPLVVVCDGNVLDEGGLDSVRKLRRLVALRGDAPYLGIIRDGTLQVYSVGLDDIAPNQVTIDASFPDPESRLTLPYLANARPNPAPGRWISDVVLGLLTSSITELRRRTGLVENDAISLVGRALFLRFLGDRRMVGLRELGCDVEQAFDDRKQAVRTSNWLDKTFNGDFLPLASSLLNDLPAEAFKILGNICRRAPEGQLYLQWREEWAQLDFAHIPVGVLSQAYERYLNTFSKDQQKREGGFYTPRHIAELMVEVAFGGLEDADRARAKILDPAAGAGVFLLTAFRRLVAERWRADGSRPSTEILREILYSQIVAFDINESALRFAALGLYLLSVELDPNPEPVEKLHFDDLRGRVLHKFAGGNEGEENDGLGSLGNQVPSHHQARYDIVVGNPPWASATRLKHWKSLTSDIAEFARGRLDDGSVYPPFPNEVLDLPFVWRAMQWARPNGQIALALHARLLFQRGETMPQARADLFRALNVTTIINGTDVRRTNVWPEVTAPFCLLFATNAVSSPTASVRIITPRTDSRLNGTGSWRIDPDQAEVLPSIEIQRRPEILKILFRGNRLDLEIHDRIVAKSFPTLAQYWATQFGMDGSHLRQTGNGYQRIRPSSPPGWDGEPGVPSEALTELPELTPEAASHLALSKNWLVPFDKTRVHRRRSRAIYTAPLLIFKESPPVRTGRLQVTVSDIDVVYNQSFHGYSAIGHPLAITLVKYLAVVLHSKVALWYSLITSGRFGFERDVVEKFVIDQLPIKSFEQLTESELSSVETCFALAERQKNSTYLHELDDFVASLYGLEKRDLEVIDDTLSFSLPFARSKYASEIPPSQEMIQEFFGSLARELQPWMRRADGMGIWFEEHHVPRSPWRFISISRTDRLFKHEIPLLAFIELANSSASSEITFVDDEGVLWVGRLNQARAWSRSSARLLARRLIWNEPDFILGKFKQVST